jgi:alkylated DNA nucleotide flippase Atl1
MADSLPTPYAEAVLDLVATIPPGKVMTYGDIAGIVGGSALSVGRVMSRYGSGVPWWGVIKAGGFMPPGHEVRAARRLHEERVRFFVRGERVDLATCRWAPPDHGRPAPSVAPGRSGAVGRG